MPAFSLTVERVFGKGRFNDNEAAVVENVRLSRFSTRFGNATVTVGPVSAVWCDVEYIKVASIEMDKTT